MDIEVFGLDGGEMVSNGIFFDVWNCPNVMAKGYCISL